MTDFFDESWTDDADRFPMCLDCGRIFGVDVPEALQPHRYDQCQACYDERHSEPVVISLKPNLMAQIASYVLRKL